MNHPTETIATLDTSLRPLRRRRHRRTCRAGRREGQRSMWPVAVVMLHEDVEDPLKMLGVQDQQPGERRKSGNASCILTCVSATAPSGWRRRIRGPPSH
jgi:hypothetical protein